MKKKRIGLLGFSAVGGKQTLQIVDGFSPLDEGVQGATNAQAIEMFKRVQAKRASSEELKFASALRTETVPENIALNPDEIYLVPFRLISATIVGAGTWKATDFSKAGVLKASMPLLKNKPIYRDHMMYVDYWAGIVNEVVWTNPYSQGVMDIPAGIDGLLALDTSTEENRNLAKGVNMGAVTSNSVTVEFEWEPSHEFEKEWMFYENIGSIVDGRMVCRVVTKIIEYHETSLVGLGADPYAKKITSSGELTNIDKAGAAEATVIGATPFNAVEANTIAEKMEAKHYVVSMAKAKESLGTTFGEKLKGAIEGVLSATTEGDMTSDDIVQKMADAVGISVQSVKLYISGKNKCPKLEYIESWAKLLRCTAKSLLAAAEGDGCEYAVKSVDVIAETISNDKEKEALEVRLGSIENSLAAIGAAIEKIASLSASTSNSRGEDDEEDDEEEEMSKAKGDEKMEGGEDCEEEMSKEAPTTEQGAPTTEQGTEQEVVSSSKQTETAMTFEKEYMAANATIEELKLQLESKKKIAEEFAKEIAAVEAANTLELQAKDKEIEKHVAEIAAKEAAKEQLSTQNQQLAAELKEVEHLTAIGKASLEKAKKEARRLYIASTSANGTPSKEFLKLLDEAKSVEILNEIIKQQGKQLAEQFTFTCGKCGSSECNFGSVTITPEIEHYNEAPTTLTHDQIREKYT